MLLLLVADSPVICWLSGLLSNETAAVAVYFFVSCLEYANASAVKTTKDNTTHGTRRLRAPKACSKLRFVCSGSITPPFLHPWLAALPSAHKRLWQHCECRDNRRARHSLRNRRGMTSAPHIRREYCKHPRVARHVRRRRAPS